MASFHIHCDQENRSDLQRQKEKEATNGPSVQQKRSILGVLNSNATRGLVARQGKQEKSAVTSGKDDKAPTFSFKIHEETVEDQQKALCNIKVPVPEPKTVVPKAAPSKPALPAASIPAAIAALHRGSTDTSDPKSENDASMSEDYLSPMQVDKSIEPTPRAKSKDQTQRVLFDMDDYRDDIYDYLLEAETRHRPKPNYMRRQPDITYTMRTILVEWMVEVAEEYRLQTETLYLAVSYIDRFLSLMSVVRAKLQLVGTAAMFIAAKYEEIYPPDVGEFVYITDDTYTKRQVLRMEHLILKVLTFDISSPTPLAFITKYCVSFDFSEKVMFLAMYLCELTLLEGDPYLAFLPSVLAASAVSLARHTFEMEAWPEYVADSTGYQFSALVPCLTHLNNTHAKAPLIPQQAVREKYKHSRWHGVSEYPHRPMVFNGDRLVTE